MGPDSEDDSQRYGIWPSLVGFAFGIGVVAFMFALATGMR